MMDLVAYLRASTDKQVKDGYGLAEQRKDAKTLARQQGHRIVAFETDEGLSGTLPDEQRPALLAALKAIRDGKAEGLLVPDLSRISRLLHTQEAVLAKVWQMGGVTFSARDYHGEVPRDDPEDPMRTAIRQMMGVFNQLDRALIVKRMRNGRAAKAAAGGFAYGSPAFGEKAVGKELVPDEVEQQVIARIAELHEAGDSTRQIAFRLNLEGLTTKRGNEWLSASVARVIRRLENG